MGNVFASSASFVVGVLRFFGALFAINLEWILCEKWGLLPIPLPFPRSQAEIIADPERFLSLLQKTDAIKATGQVHLISISKLGAIASEPAKNATAGSFRIIYASGSKSGAKKSVDVFVKFQCGRHQPLWIQCARAALEPNVAREVDFYNNLSKVVPVRTPKCYYAGKRTMINRVACILEHYDLSDGADAYVIPDWQGKDITVLKRMVTGIAKMHAQYCGKTATDSATSWIPAKRGLQYASLCLDSSRMSLRGSLSCGISWRAASPTIPLPSCMATFDLAT